MIFSHYGKSIFQLTNMCLTSRFSKSVADPLMLADIAFKYLIFAMLFSSSVYSLHCLLLENIPTSNKKLLLRFKYRIGAHLQQRRCNKTRGF